MKIFRGAFLVIFLILGVLLLLWQGIKMWDWLRLGEPLDNPLNLPVAPAYAIPLITLVLGLLQYWVVSKIPKAVNLMLALLEPLVYLVCAGVFGLIVAETYWGLDAPFAGMLDQVNIATGRSGNLSWEDGLLVAPIALRLLYGLFARVVIGKGVESARGWRMVRATIAVIAMNMGLPLALASATLGSEGVHVGFASVALLFFVFVNWYLGRATLHYFNSGASAFVSMRYLRKRPISLASVFGVAVGIGVLIVVSSIMNGFLKQYKEQIQSTLSDVILETYPETFDPSFDDVEERLWEHYYLKMQEDSEAGKAARAAWQHALAAARDGLVRNRSAEYDTSYVMNPDGSPILSFPAQREPTIAPNESDSSRLKELDSAQAYTAHLASRRGRDFSSSPPAPEYLLPEHPQLGRATPENIWLHAAFANEKLREQHRAEVRDQIADEVFVRRLLDGNEFLISAMQDGRADVVAGAPRVSNLGPISGSEASGQTEELTVANGVDPFLEPKISALGEYAANAEFRRFAIREHVFPLLEILNYSLIFETPESAPRSPKLAPVRRAEASDQAQDGQSQAAFTVEFYRDNYLNRRRYVDRSGQVRWGFVNTIRYRADSPGSEILAILKPIIKEITRANKPEVLRKQLQIAHDDLLELADKWIAASGKTEEELREVRWQGVGPWPGNAVAMLELKDRFIDTLPSEKRDLLLGAERSVVDVERQAASLTEMVSGDKKMLAKLLEGEGESESDSSDSGDRSDSEDEGAADDASDNPFGDEGSSQPTQVELEIQDLRKRIDLWEPISIAYSGLAKDLRAWLERLPASKTMQASSIKQLSQRFMEEQQALNEQIIEPFMEQHGDLLYQNDRTLAEDVRDLVAGAVARSGSLGDPGLSGLRVNSLVLLLERWDQSWQEVQARSAAYQEVLPIRTRLRPGESVHEYDFRARNILPFRQPTHLLRDTSEELARAKSYAAALLTNFVKQRMRFEGEHAIQKPEGIPSADLEVLAATFSELNSAFINNELALIESEEALQDALKAHVGVLRSEAETLYDATPSQLGRDALHQALAPLTWTRGSADYWLIRMEAPCLMIGDALADRINIQIGEQVKVMLARRRRGENLDYGYSVLELPFRVTGVYRSGIFDDNRRTMYADYDVLTRLIGASAASFTVGFKLEDYAPYSGKSQILRAQVTQVLQAQAAQALKNAEQNPRMAAAAARAMQTSGFPNTNVSTWELEKEKLIGAVERERTILELLLALIVMLSGVVILIVVYLTVVEKVKDIGILKALGASPWGIRSVFMFNALYIGLFGAAIGAGMAVVLSQNLEQVENWIDATFNLKLFPPDVYYLTNVPSLKGQELLLLTRDIAVPAVLWSFFCGIVPAVLASRKNAVEALHSE